MKKDNKYYPIRRVIFMTGLALIVASAALTGCKKEEQAEVTTEAAPPESAPEETKEVPEELNWKESTLTAAGSSEKMVETAGHLFFKYRDGIYCINKAEDQLEEIRRFEPGEANNTFWVYRGSMYYDITETDETGAPGLHGLYRMDLETGEEEHLADLMMKPVSIYASGDTLYLRDYGMNVVFALDENGKTRSELAPSETVYGLIPEGCRELFAGILPYYMDTCGYMPVQNENCLVIADTDGSNPREVEGISNTSSVLFTKDCFFAMFSDGSGKTQCWRYEADTLEKQMVFESVNNPSLVQYRDGMLYYVELSNRGIISSENAFYCVPAEKQTAGTRTPEQVILVKEEPGMTGDYTGYGNFYVTEEAAFCQQFEEYGIYISKVLLKDKEESELMKPVLYQSPLQELGQVEGTEDTILCECGDYTAGQIYTEYLVFDGESESAQAMTEMLREYSEEAADAARKNIESVEDEEWIHQQAEFFQPYSMTLTLNGSQGITYLDDRYCCILMEGYEYTGGAHGMPFREYFVFDMDEGTRLGLPDLIGDSVETVQQKAGAAFRKLEEETSFAYETPEDLEFTVADNISLESPFFLTEEGIGFYFEPYEIAPYAAGFPQVIIPYEEFDIIIEGFGTEADGAGTEKEEEDERSN